MANGNKVRILTHDEYPLWDELVTKSPQGSVFHTSKWISTCAELTSKKEIIYGFFENNTLVAGCAIYSEKKYHFLSMATSNAPITPYGGFIFAPSASSMCCENAQYNQIISAINHELIKSFDYVTIVNSPELSDIRPFVWNGWKPLIFYAYFLNLDENIEKTFSRNIRRAVRKAQKSGISIKKENNPDLYYILFCKTYEKQNLKPPVSKEFLHKLVNIIILNNVGEMWIARSSTDEPVAAEILLWDNKRAYRWSAVSDVQFLDTGAPSFLLTEILQDLKKRDFHEINMMAGNIPRLSNYVSMNFNAELRPYYGIKNFIF